MNNITIINQSANECGWQFTITVGDSSGSSEYTLNLDQDYFQRITRGKIDPSLFATLTVEFLLRSDRLKDFSSAINIQAISDKFPEFVKEILKKVKS